MSGWFPDAGRIAVLLAQIGAFLVFSMAVAVVAERAVFAFQMRHRRRVDTRYGPLVRRALDGDDAAGRELAASAPKHHFDIARLLVGPIIDERNPERVVRARTIGRALALVPLADRFLESHWWWWRRALALRMFGALQNRTRTAAIVAALDDQHIGVRAAALDALADLQDPATLPALVVRLNDASMPRGRRAAAMAAFGHECEPLLLDLADADVEHRDAYARALMLCGTERARPALCAWTRDPRADVRAAAFRTLGHVGLDEAAAHLAIAALESGDATVRAAAARGLHGWTGPGDAASRLATHLEDEWLVAAQAARALQSMPTDGHRELRASATRPGLAGALARQMLWEAGPGC
jgi:HEAT repeat protein